MGLGFLRVRSSVSVAAGAAALYAAAGMADRYFLHAGTSRLSTSSVLLPLVAGLFGLVVWVSGSPRPRPGVDRRPSRSSAAFCGAALMVVIFLMGFDLTTGLPGLAVHIAAYGLGGSLWGVFLGTHERAAEYGSRR